VARYGFLFCKTCKEFIFLGKWLRAAGDRGFGFWHGELCPNGADSLELGRKALRFIAAHMDHELLAGSDDGGLADPVVNGEEYRSADDEYDDLAYEAVHPLSPEYRAPLESPRPVNPPAPNPESQAEPN
jgi:hypothetical protein